LGDQIEKNEVGGACSTYGGEGRCIQCFGEETREREREHLGDPGIEFKLDLQKVGWRASTGLIWLRIGTGGGQL
jgi:hypothetical protein